VRGSYRRYVPGDAHRGPASRPPTPNLHLTLATSGPNSLLNTVGMREHPAPSLQRLRPIAGNWKDYPLTDAFYTRGVGSAFVTGVVLW
jgi:hypothetical protein